MSLGISLAGGGVRGATHVGVLKALEEEGIKPDAISGTSAGGIVAGLYAAGMPIKEMEDLIMHLIQHGRQYFDINYKGIIQLLPRMLTHCNSCFTGLIKGNRLLNLFCALTNGMESSDLSSVKLVIPAVDLYTGHTIAFTNERTPRPVPDVKWEQQFLLCEVMLASSSIPAIFCPRTIQDYLLVDGGVTNNLPVNLLKAANVTTIIGVDISEPYQGFKNRSIFEVASHSFSIMSYSLKECTSTEETILLKPTLPPDADLFSFDTMKGCMDAGYEYTKKALPRIRKILAENQH